TGHPASAPRTASPIAVRAFAAILGLGDVWTLFGAALGDGDMGHEVIRGGAVPVPFAVRTPGVKCTALTARRDGGSPRAMDSIQTSPVNHSGAPLMEGCLGCMSMVETMGLEPTTPCLQSSRGLCAVPTCENAGRTGARKL